MKKFTFEQEYLYLEIEYDSGAPPKKKPENIEEENRGIVIIDCLNGNQEVKP
jgi:hypothetical protein